MRFPEGGIGVCARHASAAVIAATMALASPAAAQFTGIPADGGAGQTRSIGPAMRGSNFGPSGGTAASPGSGSTKVAPRGLIGPNPGQIPSMLSPAPGVGLQQLVPGQVGLTVSARFGKGEGAIPGGLDWRVYSDQPDKTGRVRLVKEDKAASPTFMLPPGGYVVHVSFGLATATRHVRLRSETVREVFDLPAGGIRLEGRVGDVRIPSGQIAFDIFPGSQFDPGDKRPITAHVLTGDVVVLPAGTYHIVSNYGDANAVIRSDIRVQPGKLTDVTVTHHAAIITLKLVNERGGEALANTAWSVLTPGGDVIKESIGAFPRFILAEGDYRVIARNESKVFERAFKVKSGVDGEVEVQAQ